MDLEEALLAIIVHLNMCEGEGGGRSEAGGGAGVRGGGGSEGGGVAGVRRKKREYQNERSSGRYKLFGLRGLCTLG